MSVKNTLLRVESYNVSRQNEEKSAKSMKHKEGVRTIWLNAGWPGLTGG